MQTIFISDGLSYSTESREEEKNNNYRKCSLNQPSCFSFARKFFQEEQQSYQPAALLSL
jgi:hypothetical protein